MQYEFIFFDLDDTILDFGKAETAAYSRALEEFSIPATEALLARYRAINQRWWERHELGEVTRDELLVERHRELFAEFGVRAGPEAFELRYRTYLGRGHWFVEGAEDLLDWLAGKGYRLFLASNGVSATQHGRLRSAGLEDRFEQIFISEELGANKPDPAFFEACFARIPGFDRARTLMIGDSLTSDIKGAKAAQIACCWFNRAGRTAPPELKPDLEIAALAELKQVLRN